METNDERGDDQDVAAELPDARRSCAGAPLPVVFSDELITILACIVAEPVSRSTDDNAFVLFRYCYATTFGPPN